MKTTNIIFISEASGKCSAICELEDNAEKDGNVILKDVIFQPQTNLWAGYGTPSDNKGNEVIEKKKPENH